MTSVDDQFEAQRASNRSALRHFQAFEEHRERVTRLIVGAEGPDGPAVPPQPRRLCVLGAGNGFDLDVCLLLASFAEVHLADIDAEALQRARERAPEVDRPRLRLHGPLDLSGMFEELERWGRMQVTPQELAAAPAASAKRVAAALPGPFDVVASTCLLTQLQLTLLEVLGERHRLFGALRELLTLAHLRVLAALTKAGGCALLITDLCEAATFPRGRPRDAADLEPLMQELVQRGQVIHSSHPDLIRHTLASDPLLPRVFATPQLSEPWLWQNGPDRRFLCYGVSLPRR